MAKIEELQRAQAAMLAKIEELQRPLAANAAAPGTSNDGAPLPQQSAAGALPSPPETTAVEVQHSCLVTLVNLYCSLLQIWVHHAAHIL